MNTSVKTGQNHKTSVLFTHSFFRTKTRPGNANVFTLNGFTLSELIVVILTIAILAAVAAPFMQSRIDNAKWSEANATAGTIRTAISAYIARYTITEAKNAFVGQSLNNNSIQFALGFIESDLTGTYFVPGDYEIAAIDDIGHAAIAVTASLDNAPDGSKTLKANGDWQ